MIILFLFCFCMIVVCVHRNITECVTLMLDEKNKEVHSDLFIVTLCLFVCNVFDFAIFVFFALINLYVQNFLHL